MVVRSGNESIVRFEREGIRGYFIGAWVLFFLAVATLAIGLDEAADYSRWGHRILAFALSKYVWAGVGGAWAALRVYKNGLALSQAFVAVGPDGVRLRLLKDIKSIKYVLRPEQRFEWGDIGKITCDRGSCLFWAGSSLYTLHENSPSPPTVAQLMAEWKGVQLPAQESLEPPGIRAMRLKKAAKLGGIGIALMGTVAAGGWWVFSHAPASYNWPFYKAEFLVLLVFGTLGFSLFLTGITLAVIESNRRL
jgi:hypothetical protein